jgi:hypothetical protein
MTGDYSIAGCEESFAIERNTIFDPVSCCTADRDRFKRELHRLVLSCPKNKTASS